MVGTASKPMLNINTARYDDINEYDHAQAK